MDILVGNGCQSFCEKAIGREVMKSLSYQNMMDASLMAKQGKTEVEIQIFLLSRFFGKSKQELRAMPFTHIYPMMQELSKYLDDQNKITALMESGEPDDPIENRWELLDFGA